MARTLLVTGGNRGLGYGLVQALCERFPHDTVYLGVRDLARGARALEALATEGFHPQLIEIDIASDQSVQDCAAMIQERHGGIDVVIGNAAMIPGVRQAETVADFVNTNNFGTHRLIRHFGPILNDGARFLIVASRHGVLTGALAISRASGDAANRQADEKREARKNEMFGKRHMEMSDRNRDRMIGPDATLEDIEEALNEYVRCMQEGTAVEHGWPDWMNRPSKFGQVCSTFAFARQMEADARRRDIMINVCCPGFVDTDTTRAVYDDLSMALSPREAAENLVWIVTRPPGERQLYGQMLFGRDVVAVY